MSREITLIEGVHINLLIDQDNQAPMIDDIHKGKIVSINKKAMIITSNTGLSYTLRPLSLLERVKLLCQKYM